MRHLPAAIALVAVPAVAAAQVTYVDDPLTGAPHGAVGGVEAGVSGGSFSSGGWTTSGDEDTIWYSIPATLPTGSFEVTVSGLALPGNLDGEEHDIIALYGPTDYSEPVGYAPAYRNNAFKVLVRIFGAGQSYRTPGASKLELALCPAGEPGHHDPCPAACTAQGYDFWQAYLAGADADPGWSGGNAYRIVISWQPGSMSYTRSDLGTWSLDYPGTYAPPSLRVRLGSPRHSAGSGNRMPLGATFRDLRLTGTPGAATPECDANATPDAGSGSDGGCDPAHPIQALAIDPSTGQGTVQLFTTTFRHCQGVGAFRIVQLWVGDAVQAGIPSLGLGYEAGLFALDGVQTCAPGAAVVLSNAYGSLDCATSWVSGSGTDGTAGWSLRFDPATFGGTHGLFVDAKGPATTVPEPRLGWTQLGSYTVALPVDASLPDQVAPPTDAASATDRAAAPDTGSRSDVAGHDLPAPDRLARDGAADTGSGPPDATGFDIRNVATTGCGCAQDRVPGATSAIVVGGWLVRLLTRPRRVRAAQPSRRSP